MKKDRFTPRPIVGSLLLLLWTSVAGALSFVPATDAQLADAADLIIRARIAQAETLETPRGIVTHYRVDLLASIQGTAPAGLAVEVPGGHLPDGRMQIHFGRPTFRLGEEVLFFLDRQEGDVYRIVHEVQGELRTASTAQERYWTRAKRPEATMVPTDTSASAAEAYGVPRRQTAFEHWLADRAIGVVRAADYFLQPGDAVPVAPPTKFTLIGEPPIRWFLFDDGGTLELFSHGAPAEGLADGGTAALRRARRVWNREPNTRIRIVSGGPTTARGGVSRPDGVNTVLFRDLNDRFSEDYACPGGGTIAEAGVFGFVGELRMFKGTEYQVVREGDFVVNDGTGCLFASDPLAAEQVFAHELGHVLGLFHACADSASCATNPALGNALMRFDIHDPAVGARLAPDDIAGIRFLYDPGFNDQRPGDPGPGPCSLPPGHPRFCTECGPCASGSGDCDRDRDCGTGLVCTDNRGADFGFAAGIDICLPSDDGVGDPGPCMLPPGHPRFCVECGPCASGEGDCDGDDECAAGLGCADNVGASFGFAPGIDVCLPGPPGECPSTLGRGDFCSLCGPCGAGEGDCDSDAECAPGLSCIDDVGPSFGFGPRVDVCM